MISSPMSSEGLSRVEMTIVVRWRMPPDSSKGYMFSTFWGSPTRSMRRLNSSRTLR